MHAVRPKTSSTLTARLGGWLPTDAKVLNRWLAELIEHAERERAPFHPVIEEFRALIEGDPVLLMYFSQMFQQQPHFPPPSGSGDVKLRDYRQMLRVINHLLTTAPAFDTSKMVGCPLNAILDFPMITPAGLAAFVMPEINAMLRKVLRAWARFLDSEDSLYVLNESPEGWLSPEARAAIGLDEFRTDPSRPFLGFKSWNDFFIREFRPGMRPIAAPEDDGVIISACESSPYAIRDRVKECDAFWLKAQPYSLRHMLNGLFVDRFVGGTVYQAFLSAEKYHRWHSPVSGTVAKLELVPGTYFAEAAAEGFDPTGPNDSQGYIAHMATRALIFIEADNPAIGLLAFVAVGMAEVSSCKMAGADGLPLREGQHLKKGEQIGYFQFGGSTHCLAFGPDVVAEFARRAIPQGPNGQESADVKVNSPLARARI
ncbi:MAG: phosphatidylserine decarboxylase family protein [Isosphaeraceae bacterium]